MVVFFIFANSLRILCTLELQMVNARCKVSVMNVREFNF